MARRGGNTEERQRAVAVGNSDDDAETNGTESSLDERAQRRHDHIPVGEVGNYYSDRLTSWDLQKTLEEAESEIYPRDLDLDDLDLDVDLGDIGLDLDDVDLDNLDLDPPP